MLLKIVNMNILIHMYHISLCPPASISKYNFLEMKLLDQRHVHSKCNCCQILFLRGYSDSCSHLSCNKFQFVGVLAYILNVFISILDVYIALNWKSPALIIPHCLS